MQRWITFNNHGARIVKELPLVGQWIIAPNQLPFNIPMEYWKLENGRIIEMNDSEKDISDQNQTAFRKLSSGIHTAIKEVEKITVIEHELDTKITDELQKDLNELKNKFDNLVDHFDSVYKEFHKSVDDTDVILKLAEEDFNHELSKITSEIHNVLDNLSEKIEANVINSEKALLEHGISLKSHISDKISETSQETQEKLHNLELKAGDMVRDALNKLPEPKIEKIYIINNFKMKEYALIALTSGIVFALLKLIFH